VLAAVSGADDDGHSEHSDTDTTEYCRDLTGTVIAHRDRQHDMHKECGALGLSLKRWLTMRYAVIAAAAGVFLLVGTSAYAFGLTDSDYDYLATQNFAHDNSVLKNLSPKEQARLHAIIVDATSNHDATAQAKNVAGAIATFAERQHWEDSHPGQLWDTSKP